MNGIITKEEIKSMIYEVRGYQVMLASDLAKLFDMETKRINEGYSRNKEKFSNNSTWILIGYEKNELLVAVRDQKKKHVVVNIVDQEFLQVRE